jgi:hypothetical protein
MKKILVLILCLALCTGLLSSCKGKDTASSTAGSGAQEADLKPQILLEKYSPNEKVDVEFISVSDLKESSQVKLNDLLRQFYLWQWENGTPEENGDTAHYTGTARHYIVGDKYLSVVRIMSTLTEGAAYPTEEISAQTYDLTTGDTVDNLVYGDAVFAEADAANKFKLTFPEAEIAGANAKLAEYAQGKKNLYNYYLTQTGLALFIANDVHAQGDYWLFEAPYADIKGILSDDLAAVV